MDACVQGAMSMRKASRAFGVPKSVLHRRLFGGLTANASLGSKPVIPKEVEQRLHDHVIKLADLGFGIDWADIRSLAVKLASCAGIEHFVAGGDWLDGFKKRYPDLARLRSGALERNRMGALNPQLVDLFLKVLVQSVQRVE